MSRLLRILECQIEGGFPLDRHDAARVEQELKELGLAVPDFIARDAREDELRRGPRRKRWKMGQHRELADAKTAYEKKLDEFKQKRVKSPYIAAMEYVKANFKSGDYPVGEKSWEKIFTKMRGPADE